MNGSLEMWGGIECSHVRIRDTVRSQLEETGHLQRIGDLDLIACLGIRTLRYPVLWEMVERVPNSFDWSWTDIRLRRIRELGMQPIAGLLHHGSGPFWTEILDPDFPELFARYAALVARRYPWVQFYTPINEPLTTARISGMYGLWYPHGANEDMCFKLTVAQCRATALAMEAIRSHTPGAQLVQTEDVGRIFATERLDYQANHENERRWLALDLLAGRVDDHHPLRRRLLEAGVADEHLSALTTAPCMPDIVGIDYYLTSDRMLDGDTDRYPNEHIGGNGRDSYVDIAAVRSDNRQHTGLTRRISEVWDRYHLPIAVTELHNGSTRDEQLRWIADGWTAAHAARDCGIDVRAVTAWSLFGAVDWTSMLARRDGNYESGAFDTRAEVPRPTALADAIAALATRGRFDHPVLDRPGWWDEDEGPEEHGVPLLISGSGPLISAIKECCRRRRLTIRVAVHADKRSLERTKAWGTIEVEEGKSICAGPLAIYSTIRCRFPTGGALTVHHCHVPSAGEAANAILDLAIDGLKGNFILSDIGPGNQYKVTAISTEGDNDSPADFTVIANVA